MGDKISKCYEFVGAKGGLQAKMRLAVATGIPSTKAADVDDSADVIAKFKAAVKEITGENAPIN